MNAFKMFATKQKITLFKLFKNISSIDSISRYKHTPSSFCLISCKNKKYNFYTSMSYDKWDDIPLASKGWKSKNSRGDFFTINPLPTGYDEEMVSLKALGIDENLARGLREQNINNLTDFQRRAYESMQQGSNHLLAAETGCGKTIAYLLPLIQKLIGKKSKDLNSPKVLVLMPNRELAYQVAEVAINLTKHLDLKVKVIVGGRTKQLMMNPVFDEIDILVGTPGVVGKLSTVGVYKLNQVTDTVFDEADTLIDDSFSDRMEGIVKKTPQSRLIFVSATLPKFFPPFLKDYEMNMKEVVSAKIHKPLLNIQQKFLKLARSAKPSHLLQIAKENKSPMLIFTNRNATCNWTALFLRENGVKCSNINGDMNYAIRVEQWNQFVTGETLILAATDVGSRGLNTTQVRQVLNYDFPLYSADYLHRVGRIGRLGGHKNCKAINFVSGPQEVELVQQIEYAVRRDEALNDVDGNITNIVEQKISKIKQM